MELWVRSQDRDRLLKTNFLEIDDYTYEPQVFIANGNGASSQYIGEYKSYARALEVLDEIQKLIEHQMLATIKIGNYTSPKYVVYEMPKE